MSELKVKFLSDKAKIIYNNGSLLSYATDGASGFDLRAVSIGDDYLEDGYELQAGQRVMVKTGLTFGFLKGFEIQIRPRSGMSLKHGITVLNSPGTIDSDYRGEVGVVLLNTDATNSFKIQSGDRIAQAVLAKVEFADFHFVDELNETNRNTGGFGSTGHN